jgi:hypothetical protein
MPGTERKAQSEELLELERKFWDAMKDKDATAASRMTDDKCIVVGAQGVSAIDPKTMGRMTEEGDWTSERYTFDDQKTEVRFLSDDVAVVAYSVNEDLSVGGNPVTIDANDASVWVRRDGSWRCALHTESISGDPYGRDRTVQGS